jgi:hypothetical protein
VVGEKYSSRYNVSVETDDGSVWLTPVRRGGSDNIPTGWQSLEDVIKAYPIEPIE